MDRDGRRRVGERIRAAREAVGITNASEFARRIGVAPNSIYRYEGGVQLPSSEVLLHIARVTGRSMEWLMRGRSEPATEALELWRDTATGQGATPDELAWLERIDLEGHVPSPLFFDWLLSARRYGLEAPDAVKAAAAGRKAVESDD